MGGREGGIGGSDAGYTDPWTGQSLLIAGWPRPRPGRGRRGAVMTSRIGAIPE